MLDFIKANPSTFTAKIFETIEEPEIPEAPILPNGQKDSTFAFRYYKAHFFDHFDFSDGRLLYTPVFHNKIKQYLDKLTIQSIDPPDSLNAATDYILKKAEANPEIYKYLLNWMTYTYESSKVMGFEAVFVHLVENYHAKGKANWVDSTHMYKVIDKATNLKWSLIGAHAYPINMKDTLGNPVSLYDTKAKYIVLVIWDFDCGHCKKEIPELKKVYEEKLKAKGVKVFAVESEQPAKGWNKFIKENNLDWINAGETDDYKRAVVKKAYDVFSTPTLYLLDEQKIIKAKRLGIDQIDGYIDHLEKEKLKKK
jgi:peroxiredoxin